MNLDAINELALDRRVGHYLAKLYSRQHRYTATSNIRYCPCMSKIGLFSYMSSAALQMLLCSRALLLSFSIIRRGSGSSKPWL